MGTVRQDLRKIARARLKDSEVLHKNRRYDGAVYLCGYAVEMVLKNRICRTLKWTEFPPNSWRDYQSFRTHKLNILLTLSGMETKIKTQYLSEWSVVETWNPEDRYEPIPQKTRQDSLNMIESTKTLLKLL